MGFPHPLLEHNSKILSNNNKIENGKLGDISPTILYIMGLEIPKEMTGKILIK